MSLTMNGYYEYIPFKGRLSGYYNTNWLQTKPMDHMSSVPGLGGLAAVSIPAGASDSTIMFSVQPIGYWNMRENAAGKTLMDGYLNIYAVDDVKKLLKEDGKWVPKDSSGGVIADMDKPTAYGTLVWSQHDDLRESMNGQHKPYMTYNAADPESMTINVASRMMQKEALHHAQSSYFVCIVIVQWADLIISKTRRNSMFQQGMSNPLMNFGLIFETILAAFLCYTPGVNTALGTRPLRFTHWLPGVPFSMFIFLCVSTLLSLISTYCICVSHSRTLSSPHLSLSLSLSLLFAAFLFSSYDETRKFLMRATTNLVTDKATQLVMRAPGWLERNTYY